MYEPQRSPVVAGSWEVDVRAYHQVGAHLAADGRGGPGCAGGPLRQARWRGSVGRLPVCELPPRPPGLPARFVTGRDLRVALGTDAEPADQTGCQKWTCVELADPRMRFAGVQARAQPRGRSKPLRRRSSARRPRVTSASSIERSRSRNMPWPRFRPRTR